MDNQGDAEQPRRGPISQGFDAFRTGRTLGKAVKAAKLARNAGAAAETAGAAVGAVATSEIWIPIGIVIGILILVGVISSFTFRTGFAADLPAGQSSTVASPSIASDCPVTGGTITCGSKKTPVNGCGHCGTGYGAENMKECTYEGINWAIDIKGSKGDPIFLPQIGGHDVKWTNVGQEITKNGAGGAIQKYVGTDQTTQDQYFIRFHHTSLGSGAAGTALSGTAGGTICSSCNVDPHVHVELMGGKVSTNSYLDAAVYLCRR